MNRFHLATRVYSDKTQMTSDRGKNKGIAWLMFLPRFDVLSAYQGTRALPYAICLGYHPKD